MEYSVFRASLCCSFLLIFISSSGAELNPGYDLQQGLGQMLNRRMSQHTISKRSTSNIVDIAMFTDSSAPGKSFSVYVDDTMTRLIIEVNLDRSSPVIILAKPSGLPGPHPNLNKTSAGPVIATVDVAITKADYGIWKLTKLDANTWNVKIQGESSLDFTYQFLSGSIIQMPVTGDPIQGETYKTVLTVADYTKIQKIDVVQLFIIEKYTSASMMLPSDKGNGKYEIAKMTMLDKDFMIGINGKDSSGHFFRRIKTVKPIALLLSVPAFNDSSVKLYENTKLELVFFVTNKVSKQQDIDVRIHDTQGFAETPTIISATLTPGQNYTGKFTLNGGLFAVATDVTITAKPYIRGQNTVGPSVMRTFTVDRNQTTTTSTSTTTSTTPTTTTTTPSTPTSSPTVTSTPSSSQSTKATQTTGSPAGTSKTNALTASPSPSASSASASASTNKPGATVITTNSKNTVSSPVGAGSTNAAPAASTKSPSGSSLNAKTTVSSATNAKASALSAGQASTAAPSSENKDESFSKGEVFGAAIASGVSAGVLIGVAALVTMGLVFKHSINKSKRKVTPEEKKKKKNNTLSEHNDLAWT